MGKYIYERNKMKKSELVEIIRKSVRAELKLCIPEILNEILNKEDQPIIDDPIEISKQALKKESKQKTIRPQKTFSRNAILNKVLNETQGGIPHEGQRVDSELNQNQITDFNGNTHKVDDLPDHVSNALNRDYSELIKIVNKKGNK